MTEATVPVGFRAGAQLLALGEAALEFQVAPSRLWFAAQRGEIVLTRIGRQWAVERWAVEAFVAQHPVAEREVATL